MITFVSGNLLDAKVEALINPVNTVDVMIEQGLTAVADDAEVLVFEPSAPLVPEATRTTRTTPRS